jgi:hypothetical protein
VTDREQEFRIECVAAYLYGYRWTVGQPAYTDLPHAARRQWLEQARELVSVITPIPE